MKPIYVILIAAVVGAAGFFGGMQYRKTQERSLLGNGRFGTFQTGQGQNRFFMGNRPGGGRVVGHVLSTDANSLTVQLPDGSTKIVILSGSTAYSKAATGSATDVKTGENVVVFGTVNSDGSVTAQNVQIGGIIPSGQPNKPQP